MAEPPSTLIPGRVTIGLPTYNRPDLAVRAAASALAQSYPNIELLVSDDPYPGDDSADRIEALDPDGTRLRLIRQPQRLGLVRNFDACLQAATGEYFLLLGDDDVLLPEAIAQLAARFTSEVGMVWSPCEIASAEGGTFWATQAGPPTESPAQMLDQLWKGNRGPRLSSILVRTADLRAVGGFEERYGDLCDIGAWAKAALAYPLIACVPKPLARYTNHQKSATSQSTVAEWQRLAYVVHHDLMTRARYLGNQTALKTLQRARINFLGGITLTILMQTIGQPGWIGNGLREALKNPRIMFSPMMLKRVVRDGWKVLRVPGKG